MGRQAPLQVPLKNPINSQEGSQHESEEGPEVRARKRPGLGGKWSMMQSLVVGDHFLSTACGLHRWAVGDVFLHREFLMVEIDNGSGVLQSNNIFVSPFLFLRIFR